MRHSRCAGFTVVEVLVVIAVTAILLGAAAPAFRDALADSRRTAAVNQLVRAVHAARIAATTRGVEVAICRSPSGRQCVQTGTWSAGFIAFANRDRDSPPRVDPGEEVLQVGGADPRLAVTANRANFVLRPPGRRSVNGTFVVCDARGPEVARIVVVSPAGRPRAAAAADSPSPVNCPR